MTEQQILFQRALQLHQAGRLPEAIEFYNRALTGRNPDAQLLLLLGTAYLQIGQKEQGISHIRRSLALNPNNPSAYVNVALALHELNRLQEALANYDSALSLEPDFAEAHDGRGNVLRDFRRLDEALSCYDRALAIAPNYAEAHNDRGAVLQALGRLDEALLSYEKALAANPQFLEALFNRGTVLQSLKRLSAALSCYDLVVAARPDSAPAWNNRAIVLRELGRLDAALASTQKALANRPHDHYAWANRSVILRDLKRPQEALESLDQAIKHVPGNAQHWANRGALLHDLRRLSDALASLDRAVAIEDGNSHAWNNRGAVLHDLGRLEEALNSFDKALASRPDQVGALSNKARVLLDLNRPDEAAISYEKALMLRPDGDFLLGQYCHAKMKACDWAGLDENLARCVARVEKGAQAITPLALLSLIDDPALHLRAAKLYFDAKYARQETGAVLQHAANDKIRIGYYSGDFFNHATAYLIVELLEAHDKSKFEIFGFSFGPDLKDEMRARVSAAFDHFINVRALSDRDIASLSRQHRIDIAVDLSGYTAESRPGIFANRAAPLQAQYLGFPGSMGAACIDYVIGDRVAIPDGSESYYTEKILRLPVCYQPNDSKRAISERRYTRADVGLPEAGFVFCCFNNTHKILPEAFGSWMRILGAVDGSVLWLLEDNAVAAQNLRKAAEAHGLDRNRLVFARRLPLAEHLARQRLADLFLDTWPYNAHTTASDALWAGVPLITLAGKSFASRVAASLLTNIGLPELITGTKAEYENLAIALARNPARLAQIRQTLAENRASTSVFNGKITAAYLEAGYALIHSRHQSGSPPADIDISL